MKKILSVVLVLVLAFALSVSAMAVNSPDGQEKNKVVINRTNTGENSPVPETKVVVEGDTITIKPVINEEIEFNGWEVFTDPEAKKPAQEGKDYEIVKVLLEDGSEAEEGEDYKVEGGKIVAIDNEFITIIIKPITDNLFVSEAYEGVEIKFNVSSPSTADATYNTTVIAVLVVMILAAGAVMVASKRSFN